MTARPWTASLACGCETRLASRPRDGSWVSCLAVLSHDQQKVIAVACAPLELVQGELFSVAELQEAA